MDKQTKYRGKFVRVEEKVIDNQTWEKVYLPHGVVVFALNEKQELLIIKEYRAHEEPNWRWKFVAGHLEEESPLDCANRELQEEAGFKADELLLLGQHKNTGTINSDVHFVLAQNLSSSKLPNPDGDVVSEVKFLPLQEVFQMIMTQRIPGGISTIGFMQLLYRLKKIVIS